MACGDGRGEVAVNDDLNVGADLGLVGRDGDAAFVGFKKVVGRVFAQGPEVAVGIGRWEGLLGGGSEG